MRVQRIDGLPPLAWLLDLGSDEPKLVCGPDVEVFDKGFFEGCWAGEFVAQDFDTARHVFGSGAKRTDRGWLVVTPSHLLEAAYLWQRRDHRVVSNSLAFVSRWVELDLHFDPELAERVLSTRTGTTTYERLLFRGDDWSISRAAFDNLLLTNDGPVWVPKPALVERFSDFQSYKTFTLEQIAALTANGTDPRRRFRYELGSTCSSGYDSTACAVLAAELGARRGFTIADARGGGTDSGRHLLESLGLEPVEVARVQRPSGANFPEAEFIATGMGGDEFPFLAFEPHLRHALLLTGLNGGDMWGLDGAVSRTAVTLEEPAGASLAEFRLRAGFVHVPVGWIGFESQPELRELCHSPAMRPWHTGTDYERPIARRLIEERGIPRGTFGAIKRATSMTFYFASYWWSPAALRELGDLERAELPSTARRFAYRWSALWRTAALTTYFAAKKLLKRIGLGKRLDAVRDRVIPDFWGFAYAHPRYVAMAFVWAQSKIRDRYPQARDVLPELEVGSKSDLTDRPNKSASDRRP